MNTNSLQMPEKTLTTKNDLNKHPKQALTTVIRALKTKILTSKTLTPEKKGENLLGGEYRLG